MSDPIMPWLIRPAGHIFTRCRIRENGRTAMQVIKGRRSNGELVPFGERVLWLPQSAASKKLEGGRNQNKLENKWSMGPLLGQIWAVLARPAASRGCPRSWERARRLWRRSEEPRGV